MTVRWEFARAKDVSVQLWDAQAIEEETAEILRPGEVGLTLGYDEVFVLVGTPDELLALLVKAAVAVHEGTDDDEGELS